MTKPNSPYPLEKLRFVQKSKEQHAREAWNEAKARLVHAQKALDQAAEQLDAKNTALAKVNADLLKSGHAAELQHLNDFGRRLRTERESLQKAMEHAEATVRQAKLHESNAHQRWQARHKELKAGEAHYDNWLEKEKRKSAHRSELEAEDLDQSLRAFRGRDDNRNKSS